MPRKQVPQCYLALSPMQVSAALGIRHDYTKQAIREGVLEVKQIGAKQKIWLADVEKWFRSWKQPTAPRARTK